MAPRREASARPRAGVRWPAEWEPHDATWIAWPHHEPDWPRKLGAITWVYAEIARVLAAHERVEILCHSATVRRDARRALAAHAVNPRRVRLHLCPTDRAWLRDSAPTAVQGPTGDVAWVNWAFNGWAKYRNHGRDARVGAFVARASRLERRTPVRHDTGTRVVLEGGGIETDGLGTMLVTEEWLLSRVQVRNRGFRRDDYERLFAAQLGIRHTIWLGEGCVGDDTHGHVDDIARFAAPGVVLLAHERDPRDANHRRSLDNLRRLRRARDARGRRLTVVTLPFPRAVIMDGRRLPASYANFYVANGVVLVPTFNDPADREALATIARVFPRRTVVGIHAVDLVWGLGTLHCLTQQQPAARR
ncbi:MAG TPA: agmatine deiminase family protein [Gemmatimonadaceae bacterium]|nr:agmatine deiminase family protein [Gemmatimonadaceae bacterium]